jgi:hypothetical protein
MSARPFGANPLDVLGNPGWNGPPVLAPAPSSYDLLVDNVAALARDHVDGALGLEYDETVRAVQDGMRRALDHTLDDEVRP